MNILTVMTIHHYVFKKSFLQACCILRPVNFLCCLNFPLTDIHIQGVFKNPYWFSIYPDWKTELGKHPQTYYCAHIQTIRKRQMLKLYVGDKKWETLCWNPETQVQLFLFLFQRWAIFNSVVLTLCVCHTSIKNYESDTIIVLIYISGWLIFLNL